MKDIAIITGGSSGLGYEIAKELLKQQMSVCIIAREEQKLKNICKELSDLGDIIYYAGNVCDEKFVKDMYEKLAKQYQIRYVYNCAGVGKFGPPEEVKKEEIELVLEANLLGLILMCSNVLPYMKNQNRGTIVNIISSAAKKGNPNESLYCAAKWGARGYTESLIAWSKGTNIQIVGCYPGGINTPFWEKETGQNPDTSKFMDPEELAKQIVFSTTNKNTLKITDISIDKI